MQHLRNNAMKKIFGFFSLFLLPFTQATCAETESLGPPRDQGFGQTLIMIAIALIFFYFILWRPEQKRRKQMEAQRSSLKKGDKVTAMGIIGTVIRVQENTVILRMVDGAKIEFVKAAISDVISGSEEDIIKAEKEDKSLKKVTDLEIS
jgi:preprotein translocase subunit YajC